VHVAWHFFSLVLTDFLLTLHRDRAKRTETGSTLSIVVRGRPGRCKSLHMQPAACSENCCEAHYQPQIAGAILRLLNLPCKVLLQAIIGSCHANSDQSREGQGK